MIKSEIEALSRVADMAERWLAQYGWGLSAEYSDIPLKIVRNIISREREILEANYDRK